MMTSMNLIAIFVAGTACGISISGIANEVRKALAARRQPQTEEVRVVYHRQSWESVLRQINAPIDAPLSATLEVASNE